MAREGTRARISHGCCEGFLQRSEESLSLPGIRGGVPCLPTEDESGFARVRRSRARAARWIRRKREYHPRTGNCHPAGIGPGSCGGHRPGSGHVARSQWVAWNRGRAVLVLSASLERRFRLIGRIPAVFCWGAVALLPRERMAREPTTWRCTRASRLTATSGMLSSMSSVGKNHAEAIGAEYLVVQIRLNQANSRSGDRAIA